MASLVVGDSMKKSLCKNHECKHCGAKLSEMKTLMTPGELKIYTKLQWLFGTRLKEWGVK